MTCVQGDACMEILFFFTQVQVRLNGESLREFYDKLIPSFQIGLSFPVFSKNKKLRNTAF